MTKNEFEIRADYNRDTIVVYPLAHKINEFRKRGEYDRAKKLLPVEKVYLLPEELKKNLGMR